MRRAPVALAVAVSVAIAAAAALPGGDAAVPVDAEPTPVRAAAGTAPAPFRPAAAPPAPARPPVAPAIRAVDLAAEERAAPVRLRIPAIGVDAPVAGVGAEGGHLAVIDDVVQVGWYRHGPVPGAAGSAVLAAHVDHWRDGPGVFFRLRDLEEGAAVEVDLEDGSTVRFAVVALDRHRRDALPGELFATGGEPVLTLITCGGRFDEDRRAYEDNVVVRAAPVQEPA